MQGDNKITGRLPMTCEEFALACLELRSSSEDSVLQRALLEHARQCPHCAALQTNLLELQDDLRYLSLETKEAEAPSRVYMRVMQEFRTKHRTARARRIAWAGAWGLAAASVLVAAISWTTWRHGRGLSAWPGGRAPSQVATVGPPKTLAAQSPWDGLLIGDTLAASSASGEFTLLPGSTPSPMEDATVVRVQMQRSALGALGFTVNEEHASDLIQVDLLIGDDGLPQAVRLPETTE